MVVTAALALCIGQQSPASADDPYQEAVRRKDELERAVAVSRANAERYKKAADQYQFAVDAANLKIADLAAREDAAQNAAEALGLRIEISEEQLALVAFQLDETRALASSLRAQADALQRQLRRREDLYAKHLVVTYRQSRVSPLEMLLSSRTLTEFSNRVQAMIFINRQDQQLANEIRLMRGDITSKLDDAGYKEKEVIGLQDQIAVQKKRLSEQKAEYDDLVAQMQASITTQADLRGQAGTDRNRAIGALGAANRETNDLNRKLEQAERQLEQLAAEQAARSGYGPYTGGKLATWPLSGPITSGFGPRWGGFHNGLDIAAPMYTPIRASAAGTVSTVGKPYIAYGDTATVVIIIHGNNMSTLYGHLDDSRRPPPVTVGQKVNAGQVIGYVGMTGWTTGPHCHFMTITDRGAQNPLGFLP